MTPKITAEDAVDIYLSDLPPKVLAHRFGVCQGHISKIRSRKIVHIEATAFCVADLLSASLVTMACGVDLS